MLEDFMLISSLCTYQCRILSSGFLLYNKWVLSPKYFNFPLHLTLTIIHMGFSGFCGLPSYSGFQGSEILHICTFQLPSYRCSIFLVIGIQHLVFDGLTCSTSKTRLFSRLHLHQEFNI